MASRAELLVRAASMLSAVSDSPRLDAEILLARAAGCSRSALRADPGAASGAEERAFLDLIAQRSGGTPIAYITGLKEFWSMSLSVTPAVLIPRPDTEVLVEEALKLIPVGAQFEVLDLGTGSGALALAIFRERPRAQITATDICGAALEVARENARRLGAQGIRWAQGSWFEAVPGRRFDLIVCNPPYVAANDPHLNSLRFEPRNALTPGPSGLEAFRDIVPRARTHLRSSGWLAFEHGADQAAQVSNLLVVNGFHHVRSQPDYAGILRVTVGCAHAVK